MCYWQSLNLQFALAIIVVPCSSRLCKNVPIMVASHGITLDVFMCTVMFIRANIVGTIIVLSLILWIPICIIIAVVVSSSI